jgi:hypothetical protein
VGLVYEGKGNGLLCRVDDAANVINASLEPSEVLKQIVDFAVQTAHVKACSLRFLDARAKKLVMGRSCCLSAS